MKKIVLASTLLVMSSFAESKIDTSGFLVGLDLSSKSSHLAYESGGSMPLFPYENKYTNSALSLKLGYQNYFGRVYARYSSFEYKDDARDKFTIGDGQTYELNADYLPLFYVSEQEEFNLRGIFGIGVGYNKSQLKDYDTFLLPGDERIDSAQNFIEYGYQLGVLVESEYGVSLEAAYRVRYGVLQESTDDANSAAFNLETQEFYLGINYLF